MFRLLWDYFIKQMTNQRGDIGQMFTPPKSKSPWEAMTSGSTGGWAGFASPTAKGIGKYIGPALTSLAGIVPGVGPFLSAGMGASGMMGGGTGFQGTDKGWSNLGSTALGTLSGFGAGGIGKGVAGGLSSIGAGGGFGGGLSNALTNFGTGFQTGMSQYGATAAAPFKSLGNFFTGGAAAGGGGNMAPYTAAELARMPGAGTAYTGLSPAQALSLRGGQMAGNMAQFAGPNQLFGTGASPFTVGATSGANQMLTGAGTGAMGGYGTTGTSAGIPAGGADWGTRMLNFFKKPENLLGIASMTGSALQRTPDYQGPAYLGQLTEAMLGGKGISDIDKQSRALLGDVQMGEGRWGYEGASDEYFNAATRRIDESYEQAEKDLLKRYKHYGGEESQDFNMALQRLRQDQAREKAAIGTEMEERKWVAAQNRSYDAIKAGLGLGDADMKNLLGLTGMAVEEAAMKYGAEVADVMSLREALGLGGATMLNMGATQDMMDRMFGTF